jgi:hypothetical protein
VYLSGVAYVENGLLLMGLLSAGCVLRGAGVEEAGLRCRWVALAGVLAGLACGFKYTGVVLVALPVGVMLLVGLRAGWGRRVKSASVFGLAALAAFSPWLVKNAVMTGNPVFPLFSQHFDSQPAGWGAAEARHFADSHAPGADEGSFGGRVAAAWRHIAADPAQRFGPVVWVLAAVGMLRRRGRIEWALAAALGAQLLVWLFATHLYARFAAPMLIPLVLLAGRAVAGNGNEEGGTGKQSNAAGSERSLHPGLLAVLVAGVAFNAYKAADLYAAHVYADGERITLEGATQVFTRGVHPSHRHLATINTELPADARVYMVGDARPFYFKRRIGYCVVFNRSPFVEAAESGGPAGVVAWLREAGYTHVFVHWGEIQRLRRSRYGFSEVVTPGLFEGLRLVGEFAYEDGGRVYGGLYEVP